MAAILAATVLLELYFYVGVVRQYGEEDIFVSLALPPKQNGETYWDSIAHFRSVSDWSKWTGDPVDMYPFRIAALYPNQIFVKLFGESEKAVTLWSAITGIAAVLLVGLIGRSLAGNAAGLFSAAVLALIPGHIIYSARLDTDMPQLFFLALATFVMVLALKTPSNWKQVVLAGACGLSLGFLYLSKLLPAFLALPWALLVPLLLAGLRDDSTLCARGGKWRQALAVSGVTLAGFMLVFAIENWAYYLLSGTWLLHWRVMKCNAVNLESWRCGKFVVFGFVKLWLPIDGWRDLLGHTIMFRDSLFPAGHIGSVYGLPVHGWSGAAFLPALLVLPFLRAGRRRLTLLVIGGFLLYYLYQEFFWLYPTIEGGRLNLTFVHKVHRFIFPVYLGISLCIGIALGSLADFGRQCPRRWPGRLLRAAPICLTAAFAVSSFPSATFFQAMLRRSMADIRQACAVVGAVAPDGASVFVPAGAEPFFRLYQYPHHYGWKYFSDEQQASDCAGWGVVGTSLGIGLSPECFFESYPEWLRPYYYEKAAPPSGWRLLRTWESVQDQVAPSVRILKLTGPGRKPN